MPTKPKNGHVTPIRLTSELLQWLDGRCAEEHRSRANLITHILLSAMNAAQGPRPQPIDDADFPSEEVEAASL